MADLGSKAAGSVAELLSQLIITHRLNGNNYLQWSRNLLMFVRGRKKEKYLTCDHKPPKLVNPSYETRCANKSTMMTWQLAHSFYESRNERELSARKFNLGNMRINQENLLGEKQQDYHSLIK